MANPSIVTEPAEEPISLAVAKEHVRLETDETDHDATLNRLIKSVRRWAESQIRRRILTTEQRLSVDRFPQRRWIRLPYGPVQSVSSVVYYPDGGSATTFAASNYQLDATKRVARLTLNRDAHWPTDRLRAAAGVEITYTAGYADTAAELDEQDLVAGMLLKLESLYNNRGEEVIGIGAVRLRLENSAQSLLAIYSEDAV